MISTRTKLLFAFTLCLSTAAIWATHRQHQTCAATLRPGASRPPIAAASGGSSDLPCNALAVAPLRNKAIDIASALSILALLRSLLVDRKIRRQHRTSNLP